MFVVDADVVAYLLILSNQTGAARQAYARDPGWAAPSLWRSELRNVLALYLRRGHPIPATVQQVQREAELLLAGREYNVESADVLALAAASGRSAYDCEFVAVAQSLGTHLMTVDAQLRSSFADTAVALTTFGAVTPGA